MEPPISRGRLRDRAFLEDRLRAITAQLLDAHRRRDRALVAGYARQAGLDPSSFDDRRLFLKTVQIYHPDRVQALADGLERAFLTGDDHPVEAALALLALRVGPAAAPAPRFEADDEDEDETPDWSGWWEPETGWNGPGPGEEGDEDEGTFFRAVWREVFPTWPQPPGPRDLALVEGDLDLSDRDLFDLEGLQYCRLLAGLNLAGNRLDNLWCLKDLVNLERLDLAQNGLEDADLVGTLAGLTDLDLSGNDLEDLRFLGRLPRLRVVDVTGNPVRTPGVLDQLEARGVMVIRD